jgi:hypothetical protein
MIPIRLWSVVVTQSIHRRVLRGTETSCATTCGMGRSSVVVAGTVGGVTTAMGLELALLGQDLTQLADLVVGGVDRRSLLL